MRIIALDIGAGTEDVLLYDDSRELEDCVKMVLPSPSLVYGKKTRYYTRLQTDLFIKGETIGGGRFVDAAKRHLAKGLRVVMTENAAYSVRNSLEEVKNQGFEIVLGEEPPKDFKGETLQIQEVNFNILLHFLDQFEEDITDVEATAIAVQDHGAPRNNLSNRRSRIDEMKKRLADYPELESLAYSGDEVPNHFIRMNSAVKSSRRQLPEAQTVVMDTSIAAILGCLEDPKVKTSRTVLAANIGNEHSTASIVSERKVLALLEHHTSLLPPPKLEALLKAFSRGEVKDDSVFREGGHGAFYIREPTKLPKIDIVAVTGPNRARLQEARIEAHFATPAGDMMMTGPTGLIRAARAKLGK